MTSVQVPTVDLAPGMPSRVVTISATDITEGGRSLEGQMVRFALSDSLDVTSGGDVIAKTEAEVVLDAQGNGSIRLPVYDDDVRTWCGDPDWAIIVTATWGSQKAIRVPAGTSSIALSALPPVRPLRGREKLWAITGASASVVEGAQWDVDVSLQGGILDFDFTVPPGATPVFLGNATLDMDYRTMIQGVYFVASTTVADSLGLPVRRQGWLTVLVQGSVRRIEFRTNDVNDANPLQTWEIATDHNGAWTRAAWVLATVPQAVRELGDLTGSEDINTIRDGVAWVRNGNVASQLGLPLSGELGIGRTGRLSTSTPVSASYPRLQKWQTDDVNAGYSLEKWERSTTSTGAWRPWHQVYPASSATASSQRHPILEGDQYNAVGGTVYTDGATPVALTWDDFPAATRDLVVPMLRARGIRATLALPSRALTPERAPALGGEGITWPEINDWVSEGVLEIANHSATHLDAPAGRLRDEIVTSLEELHEHLPSAQVFCWVQPSVDYPDFNNGNSLDAWTRTDAGQMILDHHALATGVWNRRSDASVDRNGEPVQGVGRIWMDTSAGLGTVQTRIASLAGTGRGVIVGAHANRLSLGDTYTTPAQLEAFLDWLVAEQDAGRVRLLTLSEWAWADTRPINPAGLLSAYLAARGA